MGSEQDLPQNKEPMHLHFSPEDNHIEKCKCVFISYHKQNPTP